MFKKNNKQPISLLNQYLKNYAQSQFYQYLSPNDLLSLALTSKKIYLLINPFLTALALDQAQQPGKNRKNKGSKSKSKEKKSKKNKNQKTKTPTNVHQVEVEVTRVPITKAQQDFKEGNWKKIDSLQQVINNSYLQKKFDSGTIFFYQNQKTKEIVYINRSLVDPRLNYNQGGFDADLIGEEKTQMYAEMFEGSIADIDFTSQEALIARQKQMLNTIEEKKEMIAKKDIINYDEEFLKGIGMNKIAIILCFGGSFSLGIYKNGKCILHKSDKKYVCRKKAGERQLNRDKQSGSAIQSMGSQIRRDQEKKHMANVENILTENKQAIDSCEMVFLQAPGLNRLFIINDSETLSGVKDRLRSVCLTAKKANFTQVEALYTQITKVNFVNVKQT